MRKPSVLLVAFFIVASSYSFGATYKIRPGDNLTRISHRLGCTVEQIVAINSINNPNTIRIGQIIQYVGIEDIRLARLWLEITLSDPALAKKDRLAKKQALNDLEVGNLNHRGILDIVQNVHSSAKQLVNHQPININLIVKEELFVLKNPPRVEIWRYPEIKKAVIYVSHFPGLTDLTHRQWLSQSDLHRILSRGSFLEWYSGSMMAISVVNTDIEPCPQDAETVLLYLFQRKGLPFLLGIEALPRLSQVPILPAFR